MRLRNLLTFEKGDQIMDAYSKIGLQYILYAFNNALGDFVVMHLKIELKKNKLFYKYNQYVY